MPWELISTTTLVRGVNTLYQGTKSVQYCAVEIGSNVTVEHRYRGYLSQMEAIAYGAPTGVRSTAIRRVEIWHSRQYMEIGGNPNARFIQFTTENRSSDIGLLLRLYALQ